MSKVNPCLECIVRPSCSEICETVGENIRKRVHSFKPKGSPLSKDWFVRMIWRQIMENPNKNIEHCLSLGKTQEAICLLIIENLTIVGIKEIGTRRRKRN